MDPTQFQFGDFRDIMWTPYKDFLNGHLPWDTVPYQHRHPNAQIFPLYTPIYWPISLFLTHLPYRLAVVMWIGVLSFAMTYIVRIALSPVRCDRLVVRVGLFVMLTVFIAYTPPGKVAIFNGNWQVICSAAVVSLGAGLGVRGRAFALLLAIVKPQVGVPLLVLYLLSGYLREILTVIVACIPLVAVPLVIAAHRVGGVVSLGRLFVQNARQSDADSTIHLWRIDISGTAANLLPGAWGSAGLVGVLVAAILLAYGYRHAGQGAQGIQTRAVFGGLFIVLLMPNITYAALAMVPALVGCLDRMIQPSKYGLSQVQWWLVAAASGSFLVPFLNFNGVFPMLGLGRIAAAATNCCGLILGGVFWWLLLWMASRGVRAPYGKRAAI